MSDYGCEDGQKMVWVPNSWTDPGYYEGTGENCESCKGVGCDLLNRLDAIADRLQCAAMDRKNGTLPDASVTLDDALDLLQLVHRFQKPFEEREYEREERRAERLRKRDAEEPDRRGTGKTKDEAIKDLTDKFEQDDA